MRLYERKFLCSLLWLGRGCMVVLRKWPLYSNVNVQGMGHRIWDFPKLTAMHAEVTVPLYQVNATMYREAGARRRVYFNPQHTYICIRAASSQKLGLILNGRWLKWRAEGVQWNFCLINYSLGHVNCLVSIHVLLLLSVFYHHHKENEASYAVWFSCSKYVDYSLFTLSEWLICIYLV